MMGRIYAKRLFVVVFLLVIIYVVVRMYGEHSEQFPVNSSPQTTKSSSQISESVNVFNRRKIFYPSAVVNEKEIKSTWNRLSKVPALKGGIVPSEQILQTKKCPVCFGTDICSLIEEGALELEVAQMTMSVGKPRKIVYDGAWHTSNSVVAKSMVPSEFSLLDQHICLNASLKSDCDVAEAAYFLMSNSNSNNEFPVDDLHHIHTVLKKTKSDIPVAICANTKLINLLKSTFDEDKDGHMNEKEQIMLYSSLASSPEVVILKFFSKHFPSLPFPQFYGSCGRIYVLEGGITPLSDFMNEPFNIRASLGAQILQMIEDFTTDEDSDWFVMFTDFSYENLGVNKDGEVVILDVEGVLLVDKTYLNLENNILEKTNENRSRDPCNEKCLRSFAQQMLHSADSGKSCSVLNQYSHLMYGIVCQKILSYLNSYQSEKISDQEEVKSSHSLTIGLLHDPPAKDRAALEELLQECVSETVNGGRTQAAEELRDYLSEYFQGDDGDDYENKNEADEYDVNENGKKVPVTA